MGAVERDEPALVLLRLALGIVQTGGDAVGVRRPIRSTGTHEPHTSCVSSKGDSPSDRDAKTTESHHTVGGGGNGPPGTAPVRKRPRRGAVRSPVRPGP